MSTPSFQNSGLQSGREYILILSHQVWSFVAATLGTNMVVLHTESPGILPSALDKEISYRLETRD